MPRPSDSEEESSQSPPPASRKKADKGKGKARATSDAEEDEDEDQEMEDATQANGAGGDKDDEEGEEDEGEYAGMSEKEKARAKEEKKQRKKKDLRMRYRALQGQVDDARGDLANTSVDALSAQVFASNKLFAKVDAPSEAILDSRVLIATSEAGALKARQLKIDADAFDTDEFLSRLRAFLGAKGTGMGAATQQQKKRRRRKGQESDDEDSELDELDDNEASTVGAAGFKWGKVGKVLAGESRRVPAMDFMYGPLQLEVKEKKARTQRAKNKDTAEQTRPEELQAEDVAKNENETGKVTAKIAKILQEVAGDGIPYLKFVVNPDSFSQTVENMFYFSFLMRENKAAIELEENVESEWCGDMVTFPVDAETASEQTAKGSSATKIQVVLELTEDVWRVRRHHLLLFPCRDYFLDAIDAYDITESIIPTREAFVPPTQKGKFKW
ncbi:hypothetical protein JCM6882_007441 [Rhodosporidiobolus microsporus]